MSETLTWTSPDGETTTLPWFSGVRGRGAPPVRVKTRDIEGGPGVVVLEVQDDTSKLYVPIEIDSDDVRTDLRLLARLLDPTGDNGTLTATRDDGSARELACRYVGGFEWDETILDSKMKQLVEFQAFVPYWRDTEAQTATIGQGDRGDWLPFLPIAVIADDVFGQAIAANDGDVKAWPVWTITGPATTVTLAADTGETLKVAYPLTAGETLTIDTREDAKTVVDQDGNNRFSSLDADLDVLFGFPRGTTTVDITIEGATEASEVALEWTRRWRSA